MHYIYILLWFCLERVLDFFRMTMMPFLRGSSQISWDKDTSLAYMWTFFKHTAHFQTLQFHPISILITQVQIIIIIAIITQYITQYYIFIHTHIYNMPHSTYVLL